MADIFISYSRRDIDFAKDLHQRLIQDEKDVWIDWEDIPATADWWREIREAIEASDAFAFVISPDSVRSTVCRDEIQHALDNNKRFIPLLMTPIEDIDAPYIHPAIRSHNWILFEDQTQFEQSYAALIASLHTEPDYLRRHTRLLVHAKEWENNGRKSSYLLKGAELREFQTWLVKSQQLEPKPSELQYDYVLASQTIQTRNHRRIAIGAFLGLLLFSILVASVLWQQQEIANRLADNLIAKQQVAEARSTADARATQIFAQETRIAGVQINATSLVIQANAKNTQGALHFQINDLNGTIEALQAVYPTDTPMPTATAPRAALPDSAEAVIVIPATPTWIPPTVTPTATAWDNVSPTVSDIVPTATITATPADTTVQAVKPTLIPTVTTAPDTPNASDIIITYTIQPGDFLVDIAERFGLSTRDIMQANEISNPSLIFVGQSLEIPYRLDHESSQTLYVSNAGDDQQDCLTPTRPCATVGAALTKAPANAHIHLEAGIYNERLTINRDVILIGQGTENTLMTGHFNERIMTIEADTNVTMIGFTMTGGSSNWGGAILNYGTLDMINMKFSNNVGNLTGGALANFGTVHLSFSEFMDNYAPYNIDIYSYPRAVIDLNNVTYAAQHRLPDGRNARLQVNTVIEVTTTEGDRLNLRTGASTNDEIVTVLDAGTPALIIGGPVYSQGFTWWQLYTLDDNVGWAVEWDDEQTLAPVTAP